MRVLLFIVAVWVGWRLCEEFAIWLWLRRENRLIGKSEVSNEEMRQAESSQRNHYNQTSSGRWDALGSWSDAVVEEHEKAARWVNDLRLSTIIEFLKIMAEDPNAFTTYQRRALMIHVADVLGAKVEDNR